MEKWLATTLPEDRGEYTATEKLRLALAKHERLMEGLLKMSLREFRRSRKSIPMKKTITMKDGVDDKGEPVKIRIEEWNKPQIGRKGFIDSAAKTSHELTVLAAGYLGQGNGSISMAKVMDPEERDRWGRMVDRRDARIKELEESVGRGSPDPAHGLTAGLPAGGERGDLRSGVAAGPATRAEPDAARQSLGEVRSQAEPGNEEKPKYRWEDSFRQEALDYHCLKFGLPPATADMATGIPDPFKMSPRLWMERGYPYQIYIDRDIPCDRRNPLDTMGVIKLACPVAVHPEGW